MIQVATPPTADLLTKIPEKIDQGSTKKLKRLAELAVQVADGSAGFDAIGVAHEASKRFVTLNL